jgi:hypothetical protein
VKRLIIFLNPGAHRTRNLKTLTNYIFKERVLRLVIFLSELILVKRGASKQKRPMG